MQSRRMSSESLASRLTPYAPTALRLVLGSVMLLHVYMKAAVYTLAGTAQFFAANGFPGWSAYVVFIAELAGGVALLVGLRTRWAALGLVPIMLGAIKPHLGNGAAFNNPGGGWEFPALLVVLLCISAVLGSGAFSFDNLIARLGARDTREARHPKGASVITTT